MDYLTLKDISNGPGWVMYAVAIGMGLLSLLLISGKGSWLIADTTPHPKRKKPNMTKSCSAKWSVSAVWSSRRQFCSWQFLKVFCLPPSPAYSCLSYSWILP